MAEFRSELDIRNRALQHCGAERIGSATEDSKRNSETDFCYGKLRVAELRRNVWTFACRRAMLRALDTGTMLLDAAMWGETTSYFVGSIVADQYGNLWISRIPNNLNNDPLSVATPYWEPYFGPLTAALYDSATGYSAGELVYTAPGDGTNRVYLSLQNDNTDDPAVPTAWDAAAVYAKDQVVTYLGTAYMSLINLSAGQVPTSVPAAWNILTTYALGNTVTGSDNIIYSSLGSGNTGYDPTADAGAHWLPIGPAPWTTSFVGGAGSSKWRQIGGAEFPMGVSLATLNITYPLGAGPSWQAWTNNIFRLPAGFLRLAPQDPKPGMGILGGPVGTVYDDWLIESDYLITSDVGPIPLRFVANFTDVARMHAMFCEGLAARIGFEVCEPLTQSTTKLGAIAKVYDKWITEAGEIDAIDNGYVDPPEDELISVRY